MLKQIISDRDGQAIANQVTPAIGLLVEGAIVTAVMEQTSKPAETARNAALVLIGRKPKTPK